MTRAEFIYILKRCQSGDKKALEKIYKKYYGKMCVFAFKKVKNTDAAYDIASNVILKLLEFKHNASEINNHIGYLITMVRNDAKNYLSKRKREICVSDIWDIKSAETSDMLWAEDIFRFLTDDERELFMLRFVWDMTLRKCAERLGITYGCVKAKYLCIKNKIKEIYKKI